MDLSHFPRIRLAHLPTPIEAMPRLSRHLGGPDIFVKRDDCTGLATGGNKTRQLEFLLGKARRQGADTILTHGATQSNHVRQTAAAAAKLGLACKVLLEQRVTGYGADYADSGNILLDRLFGAEIIDTLPAGSDMPGELASLAEHCRRERANPYVIPGGAANALGALGYVTCAQEILQQGAESGLAFDHIIVASGSGGTQAGLITGLHGAGNCMSVTGISVGASRAAQEQLVFNLAVETATLIGLATEPPRQSVTVRDDWIAGGYGIPSEAVVEAVTMAARLEGLLLDPVYTGKAMAGLLDLIRTETFVAGEKVLFLFTGGLPGLFAYQALFSKLPAPAGG